MSEVVTLKDSFMGVISTVFKPEAVAAPEEVRADLSSLEVAWEEPPDNGSPILEYEVRHLRGCLN